MLIKQTTIKFQLRVFGSPSRTYALQLVISMTKQKSLKENRRGDYCLLLKVLPEAMYLTSTLWAKSFPKFNPKRQDFKRIFDLNYG